ncbi:MAG: hypothetical protein AAGA03_14915 [Planctomycetota bacterium]
MTKNRREEKTSPILMLAPIAIVLLGYHYLFHSKLNADLASSRKQETALQDRSSGYQREQSTLHAQLHAANGKLTEAKQQREIASEQLARAEAEKAELRSLLHGPSKGDPGNHSFGAFRDMPKATTPADAAPSLIGRLASLLTSTVAIQPTAQSNSAVGAGQCSQMSSLCAILDSHRLRRLENSDPSSSGFGGLVASERTRLEKLLGTKLPPISRFQIELEGSFIDVIAALHDLQDRLTSVDVLSLSLEPVDAQVQRYIWKLEVGIRG